jgi:hypothetical protein
VVVPIPECPIEIDDMDPPGAVGNELLGQSYGIVVVHRFTVAFALAEADGAAVPDIDGGKNVHGGGEAPGWGD